jgi:hypothetical protein
VDGSGRVENRSTLPEDFCRTVEADRRLVCVGVITEADERERAAAPTASGHARAVAAALAGPVLIVALVLFALRGFVFEGLLTNDHPDLLSFWLPRWSFLGSSLAGGHVPLWNPFEMAGYRFAADPQSGWLYAPPMLLFSTLPPGSAMAGMIALHPLLAGIGLLAFLRAERLGRVAATAAGLSVALLIVASELAISMPFGGSLAWTTIVLLAASRYSRNEHLRSRLGWLALGAFAWSQVANAHLSHGLVTCSLLLAAYLLARGLRGVRTGRSPARTVAARSLLFLVVLPLAALPVLVPRLSTIGDSSLGGGYDRLGAGVRDVIGSDERPIQANGVWAAWPLAHGASPGAYVGAAVLLAIPIAARSRRHRSLVWAFGGALVLVWVLMLNAVVSAGWFRWLMDRVPFGDVYLHNPGRLRFAAVLALPVLGAVGIQALMDRPLPLRRLAPWIAAGAGVFAALPLLAGGRPSAFGLLLAALVPTGLVLAGLGAARRWAGVGLVGILAVEGLAGVSLGGHFEGTFRTGLERGAHANLALQPLRAPNLQAESYLRESPFVRLIGDDRYLTWAPPAAYYERGYLFAQRRIDWPALVMNRGTLFRIRDALGYNPVQLARYWTFIRATNRLPLVYNTSAISDPSPQDVALMAIRYLIVPTGESPPVPGSTIATADGYELVRVAAAQPLVSVVSAWRVVAGTPASLRAVTDPTFDPLDEAILETGTGAEPLPGAAPGTAAVRELDPEHLVIEATASVRSIVVVRTSFDEGWRATVDGRPTRVYAADGFLMGIPIGPGRHEVRLTYLDSAVTGGVAAGVVVWFILLGSWVSLHVTAVAARRWPRPARKANP